MAKQTPEIRLLLVDDEEEFLAASARTLARRGFAVETAPDGARALELLEEQRFDVAVLDVKMPGIDGVELFHLIQQRWPELPVIMLTGHGTVQQAFQTSREGVFEYLTKPCDMEQLARVARNAAARAGQDAESKGRPDQSEEDEIRILAVDDERDFLEVLSRVLERRNMQVDTAPDGARALALLGEQAYDVVLLDVRMPGMSGIEVLRRVKEQHPLVEVILLTGHPSVDLALDGIREGAFDYLIKPQQVDRLADKVRAAFRKRRVSLETQQQREVARILREKPD